MPARFRLQFNRKIFEYDVYNLIRAFFPMSEVVIWYADGERPAGVWDADFTVTYQEESASFSFGDPFDPSEYAHRAGKLSEDRAWVEYPDGIRIRSGASVAVTEITGWDDRIRSKNEVKQLVYRYLVHLTGRNLPWGDLTGIRPTKIAMHLLEEGRSDADIRRSMQETYFTSDEKTDLAIRTVHRERKLLDRLHPEQGYSLYVGIPFCPSICLYCSFGSHPLDRFGKMIRPYFDALYKELAFVSREMKDWHLDTIYIGGGTPTSVEASQLRELLEVLRENFDLDHLAEFTIEAGRPDTITEEKLVVMREFPVTRISINPQTMNQKTLDLIGRRHTVEETVEKFRMARALGFDNINMDMIVGLPGEGAAEVSHTLDEIRKLDPDSLTVHALALKRATRLNLFREEYEPISFSATEEVMERAESCASQMGMSPYYLYRQKNMAGNFENVGYARPGKAGLYNVLIMEEKQTIMAAGSGASTKFVFDGGRRIERAENVKDLAGYISRIDGMMDRKKQGITRFLNGAE